MANNATKILVTGSSGFVGKALVKKLEMTGFQVVGSIENKKIDVTNFDELKKIELVNAVIHLGARVGIVESKKSPREFYLVNLFGTLNMLEYCRINKIPKFIYLSTYVYGIPQYLPINEEHPIKPHSPYNESKYLGELICKSYSDISQISIIVLRPFCIFGPNQSKDFFIPKILTQLIRGESIEVVNGSNKRDYLYVDDLVNAIIKCLSYKTKFEIFNVGAGHSHSFFDIKKQLELLIGTKISFHEGQSPNEITEIRADITKIKKELNWKPDTDLKTGLKQILSHEYSKFIDK